MPKRVQLPDGNIGEFPDSMSDQQIEGVLQKQFPKKTSSPARALKPEARTFGNYAGEVASGVGRGIADDVTGIAQTVAHPIDTVKGLAKQGVGAVRAAGQEYRDNAAAPTGQRLTAAALKGLEEAPIVGGMVQHAEQGGTQLASPEAAGAAAEGITAFAAPELVGKGVGGVLKRTGKALTGTGTGATEALVEKTKEANKIGADKATEAKAVEDQRSDLGKKVKESSEEVRARIETAREKALKVGNEKYNAVNDKLNALPADMEAVNGLFHEAAESLGEAQAEPPLLKRIGKTLNDGGELTYKDLQSIYSELGAELSKGSLPGPTYHAYDVMQEGIGSDMQRIADSQGYGAQLAEARSYWRRMKQTFGKPQSSRDVATKTLTSLSPEFAKQDALDNRIRLLSDHDPEIKRAAGEVTESRGKLKSLPKTKPTTFEPQKIGSEEIQDAKRKGLKQAADRLVKHGTWLATWPFLYAMKDVLHGQMPSIPRMALESAGTVGAVQGVASILKNPKVVNFLTKATPADIEVVPPDLRGDLSGIVKEAQKSGIAVSPALLKEAAKKGTVAAALTGAKPHFDVETGTQ
jgi:hypothetical protein